MTPREDPVIENDVAVSMWAPSPVPLEHRPHLVAAPPVSHYHGWRRHLKRGFDLSATLLALPLLVPLLVIISIVIMIASPGMPFFSQERIGRNGKTFKCIKFRTMHQDAEARLNADPALYARYVANDFKLSARDDPRVFSAGRFLRSTSLDELPQLLNVLIGQMSIVGPRPIVPDELDCYGPWKGAYLTMRPGITGRWQIKGRTQIRYPERAMLDAEYLEQWTFWSDIAIVLKTIPSVVRRRGAH